MNAFEVLNAKRLEAKWNIRTLRQREWGRWSRSPPRQTTLSECLNDLEQAALRHPGLEDAVSRHVELLSQGHGVRPYETGDARVFREVFEKNPGLSRAYGRLLRPLYGQAKTRPGLDRTLNNAEYWGGELRFDSEYGRQI